MLCIWSKAVHLVHSVSTVGVVMSVYRGKEKGVRSKNKYNTKERTKAVFFVLLSLLGLLKCTAYLNCGLEW